MEKKARHAQGRERGQLLSMGDLSTLIGAPMRSVQYWIKKSLLVPAQVIQNPERKGYLFNFENLIQARLIADMLKSGIRVGKLLQVQKNLKAIGKAENLKNGFLIIKGNRAELIAKDRKGREHYFDAITGQALLFSTHGTYKAVKKAIEEEEKVRRLLEDPKEIETITA